jgi:hypothetical protein
MQGDLSLALFTIHPATGTQAMALTALTAVDESDSKPRSGRSKPFRELGKRFASPRKHVIDTASCDEYPTIKNSYCS